MAFSVSTSKLPVVDASDLHVSNKKFAVPQDVSYLSGRVYYLGFPELVLSIYTVWGMPCTHVCSLLGTQSVPWLAALVSLGKASERCLRPSPLRPPGPAAPTGPAPALRPSRPGPPFHPDLFPSQLFLPASRRVGLLGSCSPVSRPVLLMFGFLMLVVVISMSTVSILL